MGTEGSCEELRESMLNGIRAGELPKKTTVTALRKLARAQGLDLRAENEVVARQLLEAPAFRTARADLYRGHRKAFIALSKKDPRVRGLLLDLFPDPPGSPKKFDPWWLGLLEKAGCFECMLDDSGEHSEQVQPVGGVVAWITKWALHSRRRSTASSASPSQYALFRRFASRLVAEGRAVHIAQGTLDLELAELALSLGVPIEISKRVHGSWLWQWKQESKGAAAEACDPVHVAAHPVLGPALSEQLRGYLDEPDFLALIAGKEGFRVAKERYVLKCVEGLGAGGVRSLEPQLFPLLKAASCEPLPETGAAALGALDLAEVLHRNLTTGVLAEVGIPELDALLIAEQGEPEVEVHYSYPWVIALRGKRLTAWDGQGNLIEHKLGFSRSPTTTIRGFQHAGGHLLIAYSTKKGPQAYWSNAPKEVWAPEEIPYMRARFAVENTDGSVCFGGTPLTLGDREIPSAMTFDWDGAHMFGRSFDTGHMAWSGHLVDPCFGELGVPGDPPFVPRGGEPFHKESFVVHVGEDDGSLVDTQDGLLGVWVRESEDGTRLSESIGGHSQRTEAGAPIRFHLRGTMSWPGRDTPLSIIEYISGQTGIASLDGQVELCLDEGDLTAALPVTFWPRLRVRDEDGSKWLRSLSIEDARDLLTATSKKGKGQSALDEALGPIQSPLLRASVVRLVRETRSRLGALESLIARKGR